MLFEVPPKASQRGEKLTYRFKKGFEEDSDPDNTLSDSEASGSSREDCSHTAQKAEIQPAKKQKAGPQLEDLQQLGFRTGPSILTLKEQPPDPSYEWGRARAEESSDEEDFEERERTRAAATHGTEDAILKAAANAQKIAEERERERAEHAQRQQQRRESYQQKEKRKRDIGQQKKQKNYVEEEKRLLRQHNVYSGFDN